MAELRDIDDDRAARAVEDQFVALRRVGVVVKIERRTAGLVREPDDAMTGVGIDPLAGRFFGGARRRRRKEAPRNTPKTRKGGDEAGEAEHIANWK